GTDQVIPGPFRVASGGAFHKAKSFQIISPGQDYEYSSNHPAAPTLSDLVYDASASNSGLGTDAFSYDNITNFASGKLKP
ncbi:MAG: hypothetical protein KDA36_08360, partial [Planctomycetaceae bacterium]|nr:hypothetical protein [Planctomycetaceae bacterium]